MYISLQNTIIWLRGRDCRRQDAGACWGKTREKLFVFFAGYEIVPKYVVYLQRFFKEKTK